MARLDLPDVARDEDAQTTRRGGPRRSAFRARVDQMTIEQLRDVAEAAFVVANTLETIGRERRMPHETTVLSLAGVLQAGLRGQ